MGYAFMRFSYFLMAQTAAPTYKILNRIALVGEGGWDYLTMDEPMSRLFVSHAGTAQVVDTKMSKLVGTIEETKGVHGITLAPALNKGFVSCGADSSVVTCHPFVTILFFPILFLSRTHVSLLCLV